MKNHKIKTSFVSPEWPNALANKLVLIFIFIAIFVENDFFQYGWKPVLIQRILIGFEAMLDRYLPVDTFCIDIS